MKENHTHMPITNLTQVEMQQLWKACQSFDNKKDITSLKKNLSSLRNFLTHKAHDLDLR